MIWRDDDISVSTRGPRLDQLCRTDDCFQRESVPHTIAVIADRLDRNPELVRTIRDRQMVVQLHCWVHEDLTTHAEALADLPRAVALLTDLFGPPTVLYPPWNRSNAQVESAASALGLTVSTEKISLEQYLRGGADDDDVVNFHYWDDHERVLLPAALSRYRGGNRLMKPTDYCPRAAPFDVYLRGKRHLVGVEVGVDAGAHAEAMLRYLDIDHLYLVDRWPKDYHFGLCEGRLSALGHRAKFTMIQRSSAHAVELCPYGLDFVYCDETRDAVTATRNLELWWPRLTPGGLLGYRGYGSGDPLSHALDAFLADHPDVERHVEPGELILVHP